MNRLFAILTLIVLSILPAFGHDAGFPHIHPIPGHPELYFALPGPEDYFFLGVALLVGLVIGFTIGVVTAYRKAHSRTSLPVSEQL